MRCTNMWPSKFIETEAKICWGKLKDLYVNMQNIGRKILQILKQSSQNWMCMEDHFLQIYSHMLNIAIRWNISNIKWNSWLNADADNIYAGPTRMH